MNTRSKFVARFGEDNAAAVERAASEHANGVHDERGSDPFKWALLICIGYECISRASFAEYHGITINNEEFKSWAKAEASLGSHDGDCDYLSLMCGVYGEYLSTPQAEQGGASR